MYYMQLILNPGSERNHLFDKSFLECQFVVLLFLIGIDFCLRLRKAIKKKRKAIKKKKKGNKENEESIKNFLNKNGLKYIPVSAS